MSTLPSERACTRSVMRQRAIKEQAEQMIREHGHAAYVKAREAERVARQKRNARLEAYLSKVAAEVARRVKELSSN